MALPDLLKSFVIKLKGQHFFKCKNKYNSPQLFWITWINMADDIFWDVMER